MARRQKLVILPRLINAGGDITRKWWVEYSMRDPRTGEMKRFRNYTPFSNVDTAQERYAIAAQVINELTDKLKSGWSPFESIQENVIYEDELIYSAVAQNYGRQRKSNITIRTYLSDFLVIKKAEVNKKSYQTYQSKLRSFCAYLECKQLEQLDVATIDSTIITNFLLYKKEEKNLARISLAKYEQILFSFFEYLRKKNLIRDNPATDLPRMGVVKDCAPYPIPEMARHKLAAEIKKVDRQLWLACCMMYYAAIRPGEEIRLLRVADISFDSRKIIIKSDTAKANRTDAIDMPEQLRKELLYQRIDLCDADDYVFGKYGRPGDEPLGKNTMRNRFNRIRDDLKLSHSYKFYSWKHTGAEALADHGASTWEIQAHLRHRSIETTERYARKRLGNRNDKFKNDFPDI